MDKQSLLAFYQDEKSILENGIYSIKLGEDVVVLASTAKTFIELMKRKHNKEQQDLEETAIKGISFFKNKLEKERKEISKEREELKKLQTLAMEALEQNTKYKKWYGTLISPRRIIVEMWNGGAVGQYGLLIPPSRWKVKLNGENGQNAKRYWIDQFLQMKIIRFWGRGKYTAEVTYPVALELLHQAMVLDGAIKTEEET